MCNKADQNARLQFLDSATKSFAIVADVAAMRRQRFERARDTIDQKLEAIDTDQGGNHRDMTQEPRLQFRR